MSRRSSARQASGRPAASTAPVPTAPAAPAAPAPEAFAADEPAADELHRIALERRSARMGGQSSGAPTTMPGGDAITFATAAPRANAGPATVTLPVQGMTCRSCEVRIAKHVGRLPGVEKVTASAVHGRVVVETSAPVSRAAIETAINKAGYEIGHTPWLAGDPKVWLTAGAGILLVGVIAVVAQVSGITQLASATGDLGSGGLVVALLLGLAAGVSTCAALVGGLVLALSASYQARRAAAGEPPAGIATQMRPALVFVGGRIAGYALLGAILGAIGAGVTMPPQVTAVLMIAVAVVMTLLGTRLTGLSPRLAGWSPTLPMGLGAKLGLTSGGGAGAYSDGRTAALGAATFFLPCGFTQAVQIYALSTGSPLFAGAIMAVFAIGTAPGLLALAGLPVVVPGRARPTLFRLVGVVVIAFAIVNLGAGLRLAGFRVPGTSVAPVAAVEGPNGSAAGAGTSGAGTSGTQPSQAPAGKQALTTHQDADGYSPADVSIYAGVPTTWTIESSTVKTCAAFLVVPDLGIQMILKQGSNTIDLPALPAGTLSYSCSMGMYGGQITIVDRPTSLTTTGG